MSFRADYTGLFSMVIFLVIQHYCTSTGMFEFFFFFFSSSLLLSLVCSFTISDFFPQIVYDCPFLSFLNPFLYGETF